MGKGSSPPLPRDTAPGAQRVLDRVGGRSDVHQGGRAAALQSWRGQKGRASVARSRRRRVEVPAEDSPALGSLCEGLCAVLRLFPPGPSSVLKV